MLGVKQKAVALTTAPKNNQHNKDYHNSSGQSSRKRAEKIAERRAQMPRSYRATYDKAVKGRSLRAAINAQCSECCAWQRKEVTLCTDSACPLYAVRPYQLPQNGHGGGFTGAESKKSGVRAKSYG